MQAWWQRDQIISAFIIGSFSMSATLISMYVNGRRAAAAQAKGKRSRRKKLGRRRYAVLFLAGLVAGGVGYRFGASTLGAAGMSVLGPGGVGDAAVPTAYRDASDERAIRASAHTERSVTQAASTPTQVRPASTPATNPVAAESADTESAGAEAAGTEPAGTMSAGRISEAPVRETGTTPPNGTSVAESAGVVTMEVPGADWRDAPVERFEAEAASRPGASSDPASPGATGSPADAASQAEPPPALSDWLRAEGMRIHYRYAERLPDACEGRTVAFGNWVDGRRGVPVECVDDAWLVIDVTELVESGRLTRNAIHCFALRSGAGHWARHDLAPSPGLERVAIASKSDFWGSPPLGFRVPRTDGPDRIEFVNGYPRVYC